MVGVVGTLGAALLTQNRADRTKRMELQAAAEQQREERGHAEELLRAEQARQWQSESLERRRACYVALNTASRQYLTAMTRYAHALRCGADVDTTRGNLETARLSYRDIYAESQMIVPGAVLQASNTAKSHMNAAYGKLKRYGAEPSAYLEELGSLEDELHQEVWIHLGSLKVAMRSDLGIDD
ncbi:MULTISPECIES: hypothetical protein [unclassified Streptomyces]|uniref:hypothetical protein n=1 Tax=unclassified Streptomyces TaxID=2593676 RepID=UPI002E295E5F|nr:hypothetical protein [Streptomyces sp. NBC_01439]